MNKCLIVLFVLCFVGLHAAEKSIEVVDIRQLPISVDGDFVGEIATDKQSLAYIAQNYGKSSIERVHGVLFASCQQSNIDVLGELIKKYKLNINSLNYERLALLHYACWSKSDAVVKYLLDLGADLEIKDEWIEKGTKHGGTPLHWACRRNNIDAVKLLLKRGADIKSTDAQGATPLHWACKNHNLEILAELLNAGAAINAVDTNGDTPLHYAYRSYATWIERFLLQHGANPNVQNTAGLTPKQVKVKHDCCTIL